MPAERQLSSGISALIVGAVSGRVDQIDLIAVEILRCVLQYHIGFRVGHVEHGAVSMTVMTTAAALVVFFLFMSIPPDLLKTPS